MLLLLIIIVIDMHVNLWEDRLTKIKKLNCKIPTESAKGIVHWRWRLILHCLHTPRIDGPLIGGWEITVCLLNWPVISSPRVITAFKCQSIRAATARLAKLGPTIRVYIRRYPLNTCKNYTFFFSKFICEISSIRSLFSVYILFLLRVFNFFLA